MKAQHLGHCLRRYADLVVEAAREMLAAPAYVGGKLGDPDRACPSPERIEGEGDRRRGLMHGATMHEVFHDLKSSLPSDRLGNPGAEVLAIPSQNVVQTDHARGQIRHRSSEEAIRPKRGEIDLNAFGAAIGFDKDRSGKETSRETRLSVGNIRLAPKRNAEGCPQIHEKRQRKRRCVPEAGPSTPRSR